MTEIWENHYSLKQRRGNRVIFDISVIIFLQDFEMEGRVAIKVVPVNETLAYILTYFYT